jgi:hypothetical protein
MYIGARGTAYWNAHLLNHLFDFEEIRVHPWRAESREAFGRRLEKDLGRPVRVVDNWRDCLEGADIMVEASRLPEPQPYFLTEWVKKGAFVAPYSTMSAVELSLNDISRRRQVGPGDAARRDGRGGRREEAGPRKRQRDQPVLAPRPQHLGHRAGLGPDGESGEAGNRPAAALCLNLLAAMGAP